MSGAEDPVRIQKFVSGVFDKKTDIKFFAFVLVALKWALIIGGIYLVYQYFTQKPSEPVSVAPSRISGDSTVTSGGGPVTQTELQATTTTTTSKTESVTNMPLSKVVLMNFGSNDKKETKTVK